jgi:tetratricopeptide (TPR) repeat protein
MLWHNIKLLGFLIITTSTIQSHCNTNTSNTTSMFEKANTLYKDGKHKAAIELYKNIPEKNAIINYNLGNCFYKLNKFGLAHLHWRRAEKNWGVFGRTELLNNLRLLQEKTKKQIKTKKEKKDYILKSLKKLKFITTSFIHATPLYYFQIAFLLLWVFLFMTIRSLMRYKRKALIATLFTFIAIFGLLLVGKYNFEYKQFGIITTNNAKILSGPGENFQVLGIAPEAKEVVIQKKSTGYFKVKINGQTGWISQSDLEKI